MTTTRFGSLGRVLAHRILAALVFGLGVVGVAVAEGGVITAAPSNLVLSDPARSGVITFNEVDLGTRGTVSLVEVIPISAGANTGPQIMVTISGTGATSGINRGGQYRIDTGLGSRYGASSTSGVGSLSGQYLQTYDGGDVSSPNSYVRTLTISFMPAVSAFMIDYFDHNGSGTTASVMSVNGLATTFPLVSQNCGGTVTCLGTGRQIGFVADATVPQINSVTFTFNGPDQAALNGGDLVIFDNLRYTLPVSQTGAFGAGKMVNISTRGKVGTGSEIMIAGFVIEGGPRRVLIRAVGPTLGGLGVTGALTDPFLTLLRGQTTIAVNDDWGQAVNVSAIRTSAAASGAFVLADTSKDAAMLIDLDPGAYTAQVSGVNAATGVALVEVYEAR